MNKISKLKIVVLCVSVTAVTSLAAARYTRGSDAAVIMDDSSSPRSLYASNCARCHGSDGHAQTALGKKLDADNIAGASTSKVTRVVNSGKGKMPSFRKRLTKAQIASIAAYVHSL